MLGDIRAFRSADWTGLYDLVSKEDPEGHEELAEYERQSQASLALIERLRTSYDGRRRAPASSPPRLNTGASPPLSPLRGEPHDAPEILIVSSPAMDHQAAADPLCRPPYVVNDLSDDEPEPAPPIISKKKARSTLADRDASSKRAKAAETTAAKAKAEEAFESLTSWLAAQAGVEEFEVSRRDSRRPVNTTFFISSKCIPMAHSPMRIFIAVNDRGRHD